MGCDNTKGRNFIPCKNSVAGIKGIYITSFDDYSFVTSSRDAGTASISAGHILTDLGDLSEIFHYKLRNSGNTYQEDSTTSSDTGTTKFTQTLNFTLTKISAEMQFQIKMFVWGRSMIFVEFNSGDIILMGKNFGCEINGSTQIQGTLESLNGYVMTAISDDSESQYFLDDATKIALKALVSTENVTD